MTSKPTNDTDPADNEKVRLIVSPLAWVVNTSPFTAPTPDNGLANSLDEANELGDAPKAPRSRHRD